MSTDPPTFAPEKFRKKDTVKWTFNAGDYTPDDGDILKYYFTNSADTQIITATDNGDGTFLVTISKTASDLFTAGWYGYVGKITSGAETFSVDEGQVTVLDDLENAYDNRSEAKKNLDSIEAAIVVKLAGGDAQSFSIAAGGMSRSTARYTYQDLLELKAYYQSVYRAELKAERMAKDLEPGNRIKARFL